ncbi:riboflavin synthase [Reyranella sp.]|uniref:riboflavin synthase n=1 Tax=Reyranella sp. TaxID=1929291 RepID=UPI000BC851A8|nr:riboflavin synthase [Reyranella sp.]OYY44114.1 MAG: riboflavin synthase [Rhodospirillales bacterium 35-66-84]OYZ94790.1 MAG: riboflavin synthase [Rhodospirillales bacterium 24-66-33]OZB26135.1 MAG: riboflavin synthase [Rhodospirillales bacterium 39-66-50]HQS15162.1 riboflavin synthase [Reyranella sp.]HQT10971.1 riboflavin synthase [Reyranella sp.]
MFTGIVSDIGEIVSVDPGGKEGDRRFVIATKHDMTPIAIGASIACSGCCLTVIEKKAGQFAVEVSAESLDKTHLGDWTVGSRLNLELSLKLGDELGGHLVYGHVDGVGRIVGMTPEGGSVRFVFEASPELARFVAAKGSIAIDGISLTVNEVEGNRFGVNVISHTQAVTTLGQARVGQRVNLEVDMLARYVARLLEHQKS